MATSESNLTYVSSLKELLHMVQGDMHMNAGCSIICNSKDQKQLQYLVKGEWMNMIQSCHEK